MTEPAAPARPFWVTATLLALSAGLVVCFVALGNWQVRRLHWKLDLIETVEARAFEAEVAMPRRFDADRHAFLRVAASGRAQDGHLLVKAVTELGPGYWVMQPYETGQGTLWVNRGFVPPDRKDPAVWTAAPGEVTGLLRPTVPGGTLMERNQPDKGRWVSRDTGAMAQALGLGRALPYFLDADHAGPPDAWPRGGMTIVSFRNSHLSYALTWYAMALLFSVTLAALVRGHYQARRLAAAESA